ncbi:uncharacterized protein LOC143912738 [Arctopsyche grandis]|uniref:uncharacterized protein LOC143912738 n=1 Tax=Arctopsyche grandis TaxID=121162 RepID=UPI00406D7248
MQAHIFNVQYRYYKKRTKMDPSNIDYDTKFKEMQGYLPFLEDLINRLEKASVSESIKGIQLPKIKSLKSLLCDVDKRMKIENLLRCEQVLIKLKSKIAKDSVNCSTEEIIQKNSVSETHNNLLNTEFAAKTSMNFYKESADEKIQNKKESENIILQPTTDSDLQMCRIKLKELTKSSQSNLPQNSVNIKSFEKEIQIVTEAYLNSQKNEQKDFSEIISKSVNSISLKSNSICSNISECSNSSSDKISSKYLKQNSLLNDIIRKDISVSPYRRISKDDKKKKAYSPDEKRYRNKSKKSEKSHFNDKRNNYRRDLRSRSKSKDSRSPQRANAREKYLEDKNKDVTKKIKNKSKRDLFSSHTNSSGEKKKLDNPENENDPDSKSKLNEIITLHNLKKLRKQLLKQLAIDSEITNLWDAVKEPKEIESVSKEKDLEKIDKKINEEMQNNKLSNNVLDVFEKIQTIENESKIKVIETQLKDSNNESQAKIETELKDTNKVKTSDLIIDPTIFEAEKTNKKVNESQCENLTKLPNIVLCEVTELDVIVSKTLSSELKESSNTIDEFTKKYLADAIKLKDLVTTDQDASPDVDSTYIEKSVSHDVISENIDENKSDSKFLSKANTMQTKFEQDVLDALINEIAESPTIFQNVVQKIDNEMNGNLSSKKPISDTDISNQLQKTRRISLEKYKEKLHFPAAQREVDLKDFNIKYKNQVEILNRVLTPKEIERFDSVIESTVEDSIADCDQILDAKKKTTDSNFEQASEDIGPESPDSASSFQYIEINSPVHPGENRTKMNREAILEKSEIYTNIASNSDQSTSYKESNYSQPLMSPMHWSSDAPFNTNDYSPILTTRDFVEFQMRNQFPNYHSQTKDTPNVFPSTNDCLITIQPTFKSIPTQLGANSSKNKVLDESRTLIYPPLTARFKVDFPVSANYRGKNPKPLLGKTFVKKSLNSNKFDEIPCSRSKNTNFETEKNITEIKSSIFHKSDIENEDSKISKNPYLKLANINELMDERKKSNTVGGVESCDSLIVQSNKLESIANCVSKIESQDLTSLILLNREEKIEAHINDTINKKPLLPIPKSPLLMEPANLSPRFLNTNFDKCYSNNSNISVENQNSPNSFQMKSISVQDPRLRNRFKDTFQNEDSNQTNNFENNTIKQTLLSSFTKSPSNFPKINVASNDPRIKRLKEKTSCNLSNDDDDDSSSRRRRRRQRRSRSREKYRERDRSRPKNNSDRIKPLPFKIPKIKKDVEENKEIKAKSSSKHNEVSSRKKNLNDEMELEKTKNLNKNVVIIDETDTFVVYDEMVTYDKKSKETNDLKPSKDSSAKKNIQKQKNHGGVSQKELALNKFEDKNEIALPKIITKENISDKDNVSSEHHKLSENETKNISLRVMANQEESVLIKNDKETDKSDDSFKIHVNDKANENTDLSTPSYNKFEDSLPSEIFVKKEIIHDKKIMICENDNSVENLENPDSNENLKNIAIKKTIEKSVNKMNKNCESNPSTKNDTTDRILDINTDNSFEEVINTNLKQSGNTGESVLLEDDSKKLRTDLSKDNVNNLESEPIPSSTLTDEKLDKDVNFSISCSNEKQELECKPENVSVQENNQDLFSSLVSVLEDKKKLLEMLTLLSQKSENIPQKILKKLELLTEIDSEDDSDNKDTLDSENSLLSSNSQEQTPGTVTVAKFNEENSFKNVFCSSKEETPNTKTNDYHANNLRTKGSRSKSKARNEVELLRDALPEIFINKGGLNPAGIRMCRIMKEFNSDNVEEEDSRRTTRQSLVKKDSVKQNTKTEPKKVAKPTKSLNDNDQILVMQKEPIILLEKTCINIISSGNETKDESKNDSPLASKHNLLTDEKANNSEVNYLKIKPCPKSKKKNYINDLNITLPTNDNNTVEKIDENVKETISSSTVPIPKVLKRKLNKEEDDLNFVDNVADNEKKDVSPVRKNIKKKKRTRWQTGIFTKKYSKNKRNNAASTDNLCDRSYHFENGINEYTCKYCDRRSDKIVKHYKEKHPQSEVLISRLNPATAQDAIKEASIEIQFEYSVIRQSKYLYQCKFCHILINKFSNFFSHVVFSHTGEYNLKNARINRSAKIDPENDKNVYIPNIIGYICEICNFVQIEKKNLEKHVSLRHPTEKCNMVEINLSVLKIPDDSENNKTESDSMTNVKGKKPKNKKQRAKRGKNKIVMDEENKSLTGSLNESETTDISINKDILVNMKCDETLSEGSFSDNFENGVFSLSGKASIFSNEFDITGMNSIGELDIKEEPIEEIEKDQSFEEMSFPNCINVKEEPLPDYEHGTSASFDKSYPPELSSMWVSIGELRARIISSSKIELYCSIKGCRYRVDSLSIFTNHIQTDHIHEKWNGYCELCENPLENSDYGIALQHLVVHHMKYNYIDLSSLNQKVDTDQSALKIKVIPKINVRRMSDLIDDSDRNSPSSAMFPQLRIENVVSLNPDSSNINQMNTPQSDPASNSEYTTEYADKETGFLNRTSASTRENFIFHQGVKVMYATTKLYQCALESCTISTDDSNLFVQHLRLHFKNSNINKPDSSWKRCIYCKEEFEKGISLTKHILQEHGASQFSCSECYFRSPSYVLTFMHSTWMHFKNKNYSERVLYSPVHNSYNNENQNSDVLPKETCVPTFICTYKGKKECGKKLDTPGLFLKHLIEANHNAPMCCQYCRSSELQPSGILSHLYSRHHYNLYRCAYCIYGTDMLKLMINHLLHHHFSRKSIYYFCNNILKTQDKATKPSSANIIEVNIDDDIQNHLKDIFKMRVLRDGTLDRVNAVESKATTDTCLELSTNSSENTFGLKDMDNEDGSFSSELVKILVEKYSSKEYKSNSTQNMPNSKVQQVNTNDDIIILDEDDDNDTNTITKKSCLDNAYTKDNFENIFMEEPITPKSSAPKEVSTSPNSNFSFEYQELSETVISTEKKSSDCIKESNKLSGFSGKDLFRCGFESCSFSCDSSREFLNHSMSCSEHHSRDFKCYHCKKKFATINILLAHMCSHGEYRYKCSICDFSCAIRIQCTGHMKTAHNVFAMETIPVDPLKTNHYTDFFTVIPTNDKERVEKKSTAKLAKITKKKVKNVSGKKTIAEKKKIKFGPGDISALPIFPILQENIFCSVCSFCTKVTSNMLRHLQLHESEIAVPTVAPVNPVPHLQTNEMHFDKMTNLALSSNMDRLPMQRNSTIPKLDIPKFVSIKDRFVCGSENCRYISVDERMLEIHWKTLHMDEYVFHCEHCQKSMPAQNDPKLRTKITDHLRLHGEKLYGCDSCHFLHHSLNAINLHNLDIHGGVSKIVTLRADSETSAAEVNPWKCKLCSATRFSKKLIVKHCVNLHSGPYRCTFCSHPTRTKVLMNEHYKRNHPDAASMEPDFICYKDNSNESVECDSPIKEKPRKRRSTSIDDKDYLNSEKPQAKKTKLVKNKSKTQDSVKTSDMEIHEADEKSSQIEEPFHGEYKCPYCKNFKSKKEEPMRVHQYEELNYRRWCCDQCGYKSFDQDKIKTHSLVEHHITNAPIKLAPNLEIEKRVENNLKIQRHNASGNNVSSNLRSNEAKTLIMSEIEEIKIECEQNSKTFELCADALPKTCTEDSNLEIHNDDSDDEGKLIICESVRIENPSEINEDITKKINGENKSIYSCDFCEFTTLYKQSITNHNKRHWKVKPLKCKYCSGQFVLKKDIFAHHTRYHHDKPFEIVHNDMPTVPEIIKLPKVQQQLKKQFELKTPTSHICLNCKTSVSIDEIESHRLLCHPDQTNLIVSKTHPVYKCSICRDYFPDNASIKSHFQSAHPDSEIYYELCKFPSPSIKPPQKTFLCAYCTRRFENFSSLADHHKSFHQHKTIGIIPLTSAQIQDTGEVKKEISFSEKSYECVVSSCDFKADSLSVLRRHVRDHYYIFQCALCRKSFQYSVFYVEHCKDEHNTEGCLPKSLVNKQAEVLDRVVQIDRLLNYVESNQRSENNSAKNSSEPSCSATVNSSGKIKQVARKSTTQINFSSYEKKKIEITECESMADIADIENVFEIERNNISIEVKKEIDDDDVQIIDI